MATVPDLAGSSIAVDYSYVKHNRENAGDPNAAVTPLFSGEIILDVTSKQLWQAQDASNNSWVPFAAGTYTK